MVERNWKVWENKLLAAARTQRLAEAILAQRRVVDLRGKRKDHKMNWRVATVLTNVVTESMRQIAGRGSTCSGAQRGSSRDNSAAGGGENVEGEVTDLDHVMPAGDEDEDEEEDKEDAGLDKGTEEFDYCDSDGLPAARHGARLRALFEHAATIVEQDADFWGLYQNLEDAFGNSSKALDCCERRFRALERGNWEENEVATGRIAEAVEDLAGRYIWCDQKAKAAFMVKAIVNRLQARSAKVAEAADNLKEKWREEVIARLSNVGA